MPFAAREIVSDPQGKHFLVQAVPKGGLKDFTPSSGPVTWLSGVPGEVGLLGFILNKFVFRGRWLVLVHPIVHSQPAAAVWSADAKNVAEANELAEDVMDKVRVGTTLVEKP